MRIGRKGKGKIFNRINFFCHHTFSAVIVRFHAEVVVVSQIDIKLFAESAPHRDWWKDRKDDVEHFPPSSPASYTFLQFLFVMAIFRPGVQKIPHFCSYRLFRLRVGTVKRVTLSH